MGFSVDGDAPGGQRAPLPQDVFDAQIAEIRTDTQWNAKVDVATALTLALVAYIALFAIWRLRRRRRAYPR